MPETKVKAPQLFPIPSGTPEAKCRSCQKPIWWIVTGSGARMPISTDYPGCYAPDEELESDEDGRGLGISHFVDCEHRDEHRRKR